MPERSRLDASIDAKGIEQQRIATELGEAEARFRAAFESSAIGMGLMTLDGRILAANAAVCQMSGFTEEELKQRYDSQNVYPLDAQVGMDLFTEMLAGKRAYYSIERRYHRKNGEIFWTRLTLSLVRDSQGQPSYLVGMIEDIEDQKRTQAELRESEARFRAMYENAAIGISLIAPDGSVLAVNPVLVELSGYSEDELKQLGGQSITLPEDREVGRQEFLDVLSGKRNSYQVEKRYVHKDGRIHWMKQTVSAVRDAVGKVLYLVVIAEDIDQRKKAEEELRASEARFKAMYENSGVGIGLMNLDRTVIAANPALCEMLGRTCEELIGQSPALVTYPDDYPTSTEQFSRLIAGEVDHYISERRYVHKDGTVFWAQISMSMVSDPDGTPLYLVGLVNNIDAQKQAQARLAKQEAEYRRLLEKRIAERTEELNRANDLLREKAAQDAVIAERTRLARDLHDAVTQTLFSTTLIAEVLPDIWKISPEDAKRRLEELRQLTRGALAEMRTLLVELRPNALVEVPLPTLLRQLTEAMTGRARMNIQFSVEGECNLPGEVQVGLYRIAQEALNNVVKHSLASQAVVTLWMCDSVRLTIADNGTGFDVGTVTADHLGLRIMRERAEAIGAKFNLYSEPGEGTQISVVWT
jgi:PAS domain S-box-containing protein